MSNMSDVEYQQLQHQIISLFRRAFKDTFQLHSKPNTSFTAKEQIGNFCTFLRRELSANEFVREHLGCLWQVNNWSWVGEFSPEFINYPRGISKRLHEKLHPHNFSLEVLQRLINMAHKEANELAPDEEITLENFDLSLQRRILAVQRCILEAKEVNSKSNDVIRSLCDVATTLDE